MVRFPLRKRLFLVPGENVVSVTAYNSANLIASDPVSITITSRQGAASRPKLHVLAVGVDDYFDSRLKLNYAVSDARALGTALKKAGRDLYDAVEVTYVLDEAVSVEGLGRAFEGLGREVRPRDVFVFFLAGHGRTLDGRYYFLPRDFRYRDTDGSEGDGDQPAAVSVLAFAGFGAEIGPAFRHLRERQPDAGGGDARPGGQGGDRAPVAGCGADDPDGIDGHRAGA